MAIPAELNLEAYGGDDYRLILDITDKNDAPINVADHTFRSQVRDKFKTTRLIAEFTITKIDPALGQIELFLDNAITEKMPAMCVWDLEQTDGNGDVSTLLAGDFTVKPGVTR